MSKHNWTAIVTWSLFTALWLGLILWRFNAWVASNPQFNR